MKSEKRSLSFPTLRRDKGVAGLTILLSVVAMIFIIGFLVMVFALIGSELSNEVSTPTAVTVTNEADGFINSTGYTVDEAGSVGFRSFVVTSARNATALIGAGNYTYTQAGLITNTTTATAPGVWTGVFFNYTYVTDANNTATQSIVDTTTSIAGVTSWFPIIITITVMVALILLTVIIIVAIRSSGILAGGN